MTGVLLVGASDGCAESLDRRRESESILLTLIRSASREGKQRSESLLPSVFTDRLHLRPQLAVVLCPESWARKTAETDSDYPSRCAIAEFRDREPTENPDYQESKAEFVGCRHRDPLSDQRCGGEAEAEGDGSGGQRLSS